MTKLQQVAVAIRDADKWITTQEIADELDDEPRVVAALAANLKSKGLVESKPVEGSNAHLYRVKDREAIDAYVSEERQNGGNRAAERVASVTASILAAKPIPLRPLTSLEERTLSYAMEDDGTFTLDIGRSHVRLNVSEWLAVFDYLAPRAAQFAPKEAA